MSSAVTGQCNIKVVMWTICEHMYCTAMEVHIPVPRENDWQRMLAILWQYRWWRASIWIGMVTLMQTAGSTFILVWGRRRLTWKPWGTERNKPVWKLHCKGLFWH